MTERQKFLSRFERQRRQGLVDMRLTLEPGISLTEDDLIVASNRLDDAIDEGRCVRRVEWKEDCAAVAVFRAS